MKTLSPQVRHVIQGLSILTAMLMVTCLVLYVQFYRQQNCLDTYIKRDNQTTAARLAVAEEERQSLKQVFEAIVSNDRPRLQREIKEHTALLLRNDEIRKSNPQPSVPDSCTVTPDKNK